MTVKVHQPATPPPKPRRLKLTAEQLEKSRRAKELYEARNPKISHEAEILSEFGVYFGYDAIRAARNNELSLEDVVELIHGARKVEDLRTQDMAMAVRAGYTMARSKKPLTVFRKLMKAYLH